MKTGKKEERNENEGNKQGGDMSTNSRKYYNAGNEEEIWGARNAKWEKYMKQEERWRSEKEGN